MFDKKVRPSRAAPTRTEASRVGRNQEQQALRPQKPPHKGKRCLWRVDMLDDIEHRDDVVLAFGKRSILDAPGVDCLDARSRAGDFRGGSGQFDSLRLPARGDGGRQTRAGRAPDLEVSPPGRRMSPDSSEICSHRRPLHSIDRGVIAVASKPVVVLAVDLPDSIPVGRIGRIDPGAGATSNKVNTVAVSESLRLRDAAYWTCPRCAHAWLSIPRDGAFRPRTGSLPAASRPYARRRPGLPHWSGSGCRRVPAAFAVTLRMHPSALFHAKSFSASPRIGYDRPARPAFPVASPRATRPSFVPSSSRDTSRTVGEINPAEAGECPSRSSLSSGRPNRSS